MKESELTEFPEDMLRQAENIWDDPKKVMYLIDLLFLFDDPERKQICS